MLCNVMRQELKDQFASGFVVGALFPFCAM